MLVALSLKLMEWERFRLQAYLRFWVSRFGFWAVRQLCWSDLGSMFEPSPVVLACSSTATIGIVL